MTEPNNITVRNNPDRHRFELLDGDTVIGESHYTAHQDASVRSGFSTTPWWTTRTVARALQRF